MPPSAGSRLGFFQLQTFWEPISTGYRHTIEPCRDVTLSDICEKAHKSLNFQEHQYKFRRGNNILITFVLTDISQQTCCCTCCSHVVCCYCCPVSQVPSASIPLSVPEKQVQVVSSVQALQSYTDIPTWLFYLFLLWFRQTRCCASSVPYFLLAFTLF